MIFYLYSPHIQKLKHLDALEEDLSRLFLEEGLTNVVVGIQEDPFSGVKYINAYDKGIWSMVVRFNVEKDLAVSSSKYFSRYLPAEDELKDILQLSKFRLYIGINVNDPDHPEDIVDVLSVLEKIRDATIFGPLKYHRKKMEAFPRQITKVKVTKYIEPLLVDVLAVRGFSQTKKLVFQREVNEIIEIVFFKPSQTEDFYCTKSSFCIYRSNGGIHKEIPTSEGFNVWYVEPDGSNLERIGGEIKTVLSEVNSSWFELSYK